MLSGRVRKSCWVRGTVARMVSVWEMEKNLTWILWDGWVKKTTTWQHHHQHVEAFADSTTTFWMLLLSSTRGCVYSCGWPLESTTEHDDVLRGPSAIQTGAVVWGGLLALRRRACRSQPMLYRRRYAEKPLYFTCLHRNSCEPSTDTLHNIGLCVTCSARHG